VQCRFGDGAAQGDEAALVVSLDGLQGPSLRRMATVPGWRPLHIAGDEAQFQRRQGTVQ
jgi:hypothetical protein